MRATGSESGGRQHRTLAHVWTVGLALGMAGLLLGCVRRVPDLTQWSQHRLDVGGISVSFETPGGESVEFRYHMERPGVVAEELRGLGPKGAILLYRHYWDYAGSLRWGSAYGRLGFQIRAVHIDVLPDDRITTVEDLRRYLERKETKWVTHINERNRASRRPAVEMRIGKVAVVTVGEHQWVRYELLSDYIGDGRQTDIAYALPLGEDAYLGCFFALVPSTRAAESNWAEEARALSQQIAATFRVVHPGQTPGPPLIPPLP